VEDVADIDAVKRKYGIPGDATACHTAMVDGYLLEGHVPAETIDRMLKERPEIAGIAAPGMPPGAPGMAMPGEPTGGFDVVSFTTKGEIELYERR
jgi:hypothetical protein